jgi:GR25 family glycosyltransferase involved in LPS biosynthesis
LEKPEDFYISKMKFYCIHHEDAVDRKQYITHHFGYLNITWITSYHPNSIFIQQHNKVYCEHAANRSYLNNNELSCYYKHFDAIKTIRDSQEDGFVFEDDILAIDYDLLDITNHFRNLINLNECEILFVGSYSGYDMEYRSEPYICCNSSTLSRCAHAYIITNKCANKTINYLNNIVAPFDWQLNYAIQDLQLKSCWSYPHIYQRTEQNKLKSLLR